MIVPLGKTSLSFEAFEKVIDKRKKLFPDLILFTNRLRKQFPITDPQRLMTTLEQRARSIKLLLTDVDGVLTDGGVFYGPEGEVMKQFNIRDGMAVERLRAVGIDVGIITGELSPSVARRAEKLRIELLYLGCKDKPAALRQVMEQRQLQLQEIAYIGDDVIDQEVMEMVGVSAAPGDALPQILAIADYTCSRLGGHGAFREFAEFLIAANAISN